MPRRLAAPKDTTITSTVMPVVSHLWSSTQRRMFE